MYVKYYKKYCDMHFDSIIKLQCYTNSIIYDFCGSTHPPNAWFNSSATAKHNLSWL